MTRAFLLTTLLIGAGCLTASAAQSAKISGIWAKDAGQPDTYVALRGHLDLADAGEFELRTLGSGWYVIWIDGEYRLEGPDRYDLAHPQYQVTPLKLSAGKHVIAVQTQHIGVTTRMLVDMPPFVYCELLLNDKPMQIDWKCAKLTGYQPQVRRINPQVGWIEWCDTRKDPAGWQAVEFDDHGWQPPTAVTPAIGEPKPTSIGPVKHFVHKLRPMADGQLAERFGYEFDDVPGRFMLRDLAPAEYPPQGVWRRYDLGRVRLGRPRITMDLPAGAAVEFAYAEWLADGRVSPLINLSAGPSCNLDHYVARGGVQEFFPLTPKGGRFLEVHVLAEPSKIKVINEAFVERCYHGDAEGAFECDRPLLNRIWSVGVETFRACSEDALIDNPTRERGQWTGDVVSVGMDINSVAYADLRLCRRGLMQSAWCAREDGLVAGLCPGGPAFMPSYAAQWIDACVHYHELTGDKALLEQMYPHAVRNIGAFERFITKDGLIDGAGWVFVDWGYVRNEGPADIGMNLHFLSALRSMQRWCSTIGKDSDLPKYRELSEQIEKVVTTWLTQQWQAGGEQPWSKVGYHNAVLALRNGLVAPNRKAECIDYIKSHIMNCFPNNPDAPRLADPAAVNRQLITPYFAHYAFPTLIEAGEMDFVLGQYEKCWGFGLQNDRTTWIEVFDTRWSHCHQWAGCPTWQLSRYVLGLHPRFDLGQNNYAFKLIPGSLGKAAGKVPLPDGKGQIEVSWRRQGNTITYSLKSPEPIRLHHVKPNQPPIEVRDTYEVTIPSEQH